MHASIFTYIHAFIFTYMHAFITWDRILKRMMRLPRDEEWSQASNVECISVLQFQMSNAFHIHRSLFHFKSTDKGRFFGNRAGLMSHVFGCSTVQVLVRFGFLSGFHFTSIDHFLQARSCSEFVHDLDYSA